MHSRRLRLFLDSTSETADDVVTMVEALHERHLPGCGPLEVIDVSSDAEQAREAGVMAVPTLEYEAGEVTRRAVGNLADEATTVRALGLATECEETREGDDAQQ